MIIGQCSLKTASLRTRDINYVKKSSWDVNEKRKERREAVSKDSGVEIICVAQWADLGDGGGRRGPFLWDMK